MLVHEYGCRVREQMHSCLHPLQPAQEMERPLTQDLVTAELLSSALCSTHDLHLTLLLGLWTRSASRFRFLNLKHVTSAEVEQMVDIFSQLTFLNRTFLKPVVPPVLGFRATLKGSA